MTQHFEPIPPEREQQYLQNAEQTMQDVETSLGQGVAADAEAMLEALRDGAAVGDEAESFANSHDVIDIDGGRLVSEATVFVDAVNSIRHAHDPIEEAKVAVHQISSDPTTQSKLFLQMAFAAQDSTQIKKFKQ